MADLKSPSITIAFNEAGSSAIQRGERGIVALVLTDEKAGKYDVHDVTEIPEGLNAKNTQYIKDALIGYVNAPKKVLVEVITGTDYTEVLKDLATEKFNYLAIPGISTTKAEGAETAPTADIASWIKSQNEQNHLNAMAILPETATDYENVVGWWTTLYRDAETSLTPSEGTARIAGLLAGTGLTRSATYAPLGDFIDCTRLPKDERDEAVSSGKLIAYWDGEKVKLNRAVTSFVTTGQGKQDSFKKIRLVDIMNMIDSDIRSTIEDAYIGKYTNSYDNKCLLITAINAYFATLVADSALSSGVCSIDIPTQRNYLAGTGKPVMLADGTTKKVADCTDDEIKTADTGSHVFLTATIRLLDAIEDVDLAINI